MGARSVALLVVLLHTTTPTVTAPAIASLQVVLVGGSNLHHQKEWYTRTGLLLLQQGHSKFMWYRKLLIVWNNKLVVTMMVRRLFNQS